MAFTKGKSGNPGGRPKGLQRLIREKLGKKGWSRVVETQYLIATGQFVSDSKLGLQAKEVTAAAKWLADRGFGLPQQHVDVTSAGSGVGQVAVAFDTSLMNDEQLEEVERRLAEASGAEDENDDRAASDDELGGEGDDMDRPDGPEVVDLDPDERGKGSGGRSGLN